MADHSDNYSKAQKSALADFVATPKMGLVGPYVDDDIGRAISRYGAQAVKEAVARATKAKPGRKSKMNWRNIRSIIEEDATLWLEGGDPFSERTNYSIQKYYADNFPGHSHPATMKMVERHLKDSRAWITYATAEHLSKDGYPYATHIAALKALGDALGHEEYIIHQFALRSVAEYQTRTGERPPDEMSMAQIEEELRKPTAPKKLPLTGLLAPYANSKSD